MDTVNKKGFTLIEVLAVIALVGILILFVMPNLTKIFSGSIKKTMKLQENELKDAGLMYLEDFCKNKLENKTCPSTIKINETNKYSGYVNLNTLIKEDYIEEIDIQGSKCSGCVIFTNNKAQAYLTCEDVYETDSSVNYKNECGLN